MPASCHILLIKTAFYNASFGQFFLHSKQRIHSVPFFRFQANVKRFGDYLNRFDKDSQFIVVTHRKGTMAAADSIYGVTMQESGVSKIVSVKLKDLEETVD